MPQAEKPVPPPAPLPDECCGTGCIPCVMDLYQEALDEYQAALARWERGEAVRVPEPAG